MKQSPLHIQIQDEITMAGGRNGLAMLIMNESPEWFTHQQMQIMRERIYKTEHMRRKRADSPFADRMWKAEDELYVMQKYGKIGTMQIAATLKRSASAVRLKFYEKATPSQKNWVEAHGINANKGKHLRNR